MFHFIYNIRKSNNKILPHHGLQKNISFYKENVEKKSGDGERTRLL